MADAAVQDPSKPNPNEGTLPPSPYPKRWYASDRVFAEGDQLQHFGHDRADLPLDAPGFHIIGPCPSCGHGTSALCATEYLSLDLPVSRGGVVPVRVRTSSATRSAGYSRLRVATTSDRTLGSDQIEELTRDIGGSVSLGDEILASHPALPPRNDVKVKTMITVVRCACVANHVPPTAGTFGCGSEWLVRVTFDAGNPNETNLTPVTHEEAFRSWAMADAAAAAVPNTLTAAQSAVGKWQAALTAIIAVLGVGALLGARSTIQTLSTGWETLFAIAVAVAVAANIVVLLQSDLASFGFPNIRQALAPSDLQNADLDPLIQARVAIRKLRAAMWATGVAVLAAALAVAIVLFVHDELPGPTYKVTTVVGKTTTTTSCGTITPAPKLGQALPTTVTFKPAADGSRSVTIAANTITTIAGC